jgi:Mrr N-terminal domain/Inorganic pyrophosphatase
MAIPDYQTVMLPLLRFAADKREHSTREAIEELANHFSLTEDERKELLPSGSQATLDNRVGWTRTYMRKAGLLESPRRGYLTITERGLEALANNPEAINVKFLEQYPEFLEFKAKSNVKSTTPEPDTTGPTEERTPREVMEDAYGTIRTQLASDLLDVLVLMQEPVQPLSILRARPIGMMHMVDEERTTRSSASTSTIWSTDLTSAWTSCNASSRTIRCWRAKRWTWDIFRARRRRSGPSGTRWISTRSTSSSLPKWQTLDLRGLRPRLKRGCSG